MIEKVHAVSKAWLPLNDGESIDLQKALVDLKTSFNCNECWYDEHFNRLIIKQPDKKISATFFYTGKVMLFGLVAEHVLATFLNDIWRDFLKKKRGQTKHYTLNIRS